MNKDVIYIEPEDDITDILAKVKNAKNKIVALVPPKKAGVLRSAVNIKLIAKTAARSGKTVVLISTDESLMKLAMAANIPVAKTLQSKPQIPKEFPKADIGDEPSDVIEAKKPEKKFDKSEKDTKEVKAEKTDDEVRPPFKTAKEEAGKDTPVKAREDDDTLELSSDDLEERKSVRGAKKALPTKVPNFKKYLKWIIAGGVLLVLLIVFLIWTLVIAPKATINVKIKTSESNFAEKVTFVTGEETAKPEEGIFYVEQKTVDKKVETEFEATGELDKGQKATGTIQVIIPKGTSTTQANIKSGAAIGSGYVFTFGEIAFKAVEGGSIVYDLDDLEEVVCTGNSNCKTMVDKTISVKVEAAENGDKYNIAASSDWKFTSQTWYSSSAKISGSEMTGGSSEIVKTVSKDDIEKAKTSITMPSDDEIRDELASQFDSDYLIIKSSLTATEAKYTSDPDLEGEVKDDKKPKLTLERSYSVYAVKRADVNAFIEKKASENIGDDTQTIYSTGVSGFEKKLASNSDTSANAEKDTAFFDSYKNSDGEITAKLKSVVLKVPEVSEDIILETALGSKKSDVYRNLMSINGVSSVEINVKPFSTIPKDKERVTINIELVK